jgi:hypothetical protein
LYKVRALLDLISPRFDSEYNIHQECAIDEAMIPYKGRLAIKQYIKNKPTKWGIKSFVLADATNGYVKRFQIYCGKGVDCNNDVGLCTRVVLELLDGLKDSGLHLYTDNYYTSPVLFHHLYHCGINACGTCRSNRAFFPIDKLHLDCTIENRSRMKYRSNGPVLAVSWVDKKVINFVSTMHVAEADCAVLRRAKNGTAEEFRCPPLLPDYVKYMRGVDRGDQLISYYNLGWKSRKWWRRVFFYILECSILNSFVLNMHVRPHEHARKGRRKLDMLEFKLVLGHLLIDAHANDLVIQGVMTMRT